MSRSVLSARTESAVVHTHSIKRRMTIALLLLTAVLFCGVVLGSSVGPMSVPFDKTVAVLLQRLGVGLDVAVSDREALVIDQVRLPRVLVAVFVGAAVATTGTILQGWYRNHCA